MIIYLYVKQHSITKLKYFGMTRSNPFKYFGSGYYWKSHIKKYGKPHIKTLEVWGFDDQELCTEFALKFSKDNNIVESKEWANLVEENALSGTPCGRFVSEETREKHRIAAKNISQETRIKRSIAAKNMSDDTKQKMRNYALNRPQEHREKIVKSNTGRIFSKEARQNISNARKNMSAESRLKYSQSRKGKKVITDGIKRKMFDPKLQLPIGWWYIKP